jgi:hypothetical protein
MIVLFVGVVLVGGKLLGQFDKGPVPLEVHYLVPAGTAAVEVVVSPPSGGAAVATFESHDPGPDVVSHSRLPAGDNDFAITLVDGIGGRRTLNRTVEVRRDAVVRIDLTQ